MNRLRHKLIFISVMLCFLLPPVAPAQQVSSAEVSRNHPSAIAKINCRGPMKDDAPLTDDSEQAMPLRILAELKCGDEVTILSDTTGYTVLVRAGDGQSGYVARQRLTPFAPPAQASSQDDPKIAAADLKSSSEPPSGAAPEESAASVLRWQHSAAGSDEFLRDGRIVKSLALHGVTVQVSLRDTGWEFRADVTVVNSSTQRFDLLPSRFVLNNRPAITDTGKLLNPITLRATTLLPNTTAYGCAWFARDLKSNPAWVRIPVGAEVFEFPFILSH